MADGAADAAGARPKKGELTRRLEEQAGEIADLRWRLDRAEFRTDLMWQPTRVVVEGSDKLEELYKEVEESGDFASLRARIPPALLSEIATKLGLPWPWEAPAAGAAEGGGNEAAEPAAEPMAVDAGGPGAEADGAAAAAAAQPGADGGGGGGVGDGAAAGGEGKGQGKGGGREPSRQVVERAFGIFAGALGPEALPKLDPNRSRGSWHNGVFTRSPTHFLLTFKWGGRAIRIADMLFEGLERALAGKPGVVLYLDKTPAQREAKRRRQEGKGAQEGGKAKGKGKGKEGKAGRGGGRH